MALLIKSVSVPSTLNWDFNSQQELKIRLTQNISQIARVLNAKETGVYDTLETLNGQQYFQNPLLDSSSIQTPAVRNVFRKVINYTTALPNTGSVAIPHYIVCTEVTSFTRIYGVANDPVNFVYLSLPYSSPTLANNIELQVDGTNVTITTGSNRTAFTVTYVVLEYLQN